MWKPDRSLQSINMRNSVRILAFLAAGAVCAGCAPAPRVTMTLSHDEVRVNDPTLVTIDRTVHIQASDLLKRLSESALLLQGGSKPWAEVSDTLDEMVNDALVTFTLDTFDIRSDTASWVNYNLTRDNLLKRELLNQTIYPRVEIDSLMVDSFYFAREDLFTYGSQVNVGHIVLSKPGYRYGNDSAAYAPYSDHELDSMIYFRLNLLKSEIGDSLDFEHMAKLYSLDGRTGGLGGRFGWVQKNNLHPEIEEVLYDPNTPLHTVIGPLESRDGVHLFYLYNRHFEGIPPLNPERYDHARGIMLNMFAQGVVAQLLDSLRAARPTVYNDSALQLGSRQGEPSLWVAWAEGIDTVRFTEYDNACVPFRSRFNTLTFTVEQGRYIAQTLVDERLLIVLAEELGIPEQPVVSEELERNRLKYARVAVNRLGEAPGYVPGEELIEAYFETHQRDFISERPVKLQQILVADSLHAEFVKALAESGEDFLTLAERHYVGEPDIRRAAADLGWIGERDFDSTIFATSYAALDGSVLGPIKTEYGYHVVRVEEVKRAPSLVEVRTEIYTELVRQERERVHAAWERMLRRNHTVDYHPVEIDSLVLPPIEFRRERPTVSNTVRSL